MALERSGCGWARKDHKLAGSPNWPLKVLTHANKWLKRGTITNCHKVIAELNDDWSRTQVQQSIKKGHVLVNGEKTKANYKACLNDVVEINIPEPEILDVEPEEMDLDIYYEDRDIIVVNKPKGMVVHPGPGHFRGTLVNGLLAHCKDLSGINGVLRPVLFTVWTKIRPVVWWLQKMTKPMRIWPFSSRKKRW